MPKAGIAGVPFVALMHISGKQIKVVWSWIFLGQEAKKNPTQRPAILFF